MRHGHLVASLVLACVLNAGLAQITHGLDARLLEVASHRLVDLLRLDVAKADLNGLIAVSLFGLYLRHRAGASQNDGDGDDVVVFIPHLGHPKLTAENCVDHSLSLPSVVMGRQL